ncbi:MAG: serine/threonine-protein kinase, partial [Myxococcota bacterium]
MSLHERFELGALLGAGAMGRVHAATHRRSGLEVAVKRMAPDADPERFAHEVSAVAQLDHPHVVWVIDQGRDASGRPWLAMQRATGTLADETGARWSRIRAALVRLLDALAHAHARGVIHRDIKPSNVLVTMHDGEPVPKVIDFGIAKATSAELTQKTLFTEHRQVVGTPAYMA